MAIKNWPSSIPKFNSPEGRLELENFAKSIENECKVPEIGFDHEGIMEHVRDHFYNISRRCKGPMKVKI